MSITLFIPSPAAPRHAKGGDITVRVERCGGGGGDFRASICCDLAHGGRPGNRHDLGRDRLLGSDQALADSHRARRLSARRAVPQMPRLSRISSAALSAAALAKVFLWKCPKCGWWNQHTDRLCYKCTCPQSTDILHPDLRTAGRTRSNQPSDASHRRARARAGDVSTRHDQLRGDRAIEGFDPPLPTVTWTRASCRADTSPARLARLAQSDRGPVGGARGLRRERQSLVRPRIAGGGG